VDQIMHRHGLIDSAQLVEAVRPQGTDAKSEIDLAKRTAGNLHPQLI
jgi:hypothetical protein